MFFLKHSNFVIVMTFILDVIKIIIFFKDLQQTDNLTLIIIIYLN